MEFAETTAAIIRGLIKQTALVMVTVAAGRYMGWW